MSYVQSHYHIVFRTKRSERTISEDKERQLYMYIYTFSVDRGCHVYRIGGMPDHVHILVDLPATLALADYVRQLKACSSKWMHQSKTFPRFKGWAEGYAAISCDHERIETVINYIKGQKEHHKKLTFAEEYRNWLLSVGEEIDERYFLKDD